MGPRVDHAVGRWNWSREWTDHVYAEFPAPAAASGAAEHTAPAPQGSATAAASGATEHAAPPPHPVVPILLDLQGLAAARNVQGLSKLALHERARNALNTFANADYAGPVNLDDLFPWRSYLAFHAKGEMLVGPGICRAVVDHLPNVRDPNRGGRPRTDFILTRVDGSAYRIHPGSRPTNDSIPVYCPVGRATEQTVVCRWYSLDELQCFTLEDARQVPQTDRI